MLRTLIVMVALLATIVGLVRLTSSPAQAMPAPVVAAEPEPSGKEIRMVKVPYELTLSAEAEGLTMGGCMGVVLKEKTSGPVTGSFMMREDDHQAILIRIAWVKDQAPGHRFAKLRLEPPGKPTLEHVFDSPGDIDDIWLRGQ